MKNNWTLRMRCMDAMIAFCVKKHHRSMSALKSDKYAIANTGMKNLRHLHVQVHINASNSKSRWDTLRCRSRPNSLVKELELLGYWTSNYSPLNMIYKSKFRKFHRCLFTLLTPLLHPLHTTPRHYVRELTPREFRNILVILLYNEVMPNTSKSYFHLVFYG